MPSTRAALRSHAPHEGSDVATTMPPSSTPPASKRTPLGEITGNQEEVPIVLPDPEEVLKAKQGPSKGKKSKSSKKPKKSAQNTEDGESGKVLPDENQSDTSSAVDNACQDLLKEQPQDTSSVIVHEDRPSTPPSPAVAAATSALQISATPTPSDNEAMDQGNSDCQATVLSTEKQADSTSSPNQMHQEPKPEDDGAGKEENEALRSEKKKSPNRVSMRPEDSIEAMDKFEEEMEKVGDLLPVVKKSGQPPKGRKRNAVKDGVAKDRTGNQGLAPTQQPQNGSSSKQKTSLVDSNNVTRAKRGPAAVATTVPPANGTTTSPTTRKVSDSSSTSENSTSIAVKKRVSSVHKAPFVPTKSSKPPTRASFELPGEAVARRLREAREERLKREEEQKDVPRKTSFKARPVRLSQAPIVKPTATSRARISMAKGETPAAVATTKSPVPKSNPLSSAGTASNGNAGKRLSTLSVNKRAAPTSANTSARVNRASAVTAQNGPQATKIRQSMQSSVRPSITAADAAQMKAKGKSIFNRGRIEHDELEQMKKDKKDAAKKARAEAAERGRIASREWAEKQKAKKVAAKRGGADATTVGCEVSVPA
ncbi:MAG: hypothetical protein Q9169_002404 [Polycauliona sp. 2 TL-2023]